MVTTSSLLLRTSLFCALEPGLETGKYWDNCRYDIDNDANVENDDMNNYDNNDREGTVSSLAQDKMQALELWKVSAEIVQLEN